MTSQSMKSKQEIICSEGLNYNLQFTKPYLMTAKIFDFGCWVSADIYLSIIYSFNFKGKDQRKISSYFFVVTERFRQVTPILKSHQKEGKDEG